MITSPLPPIGGWVAPGFERVRDAFISNFHRADGDSEVGAALAVYLRGACVVDLWGGHADAARTRPWARDTLVNVWSATKGIAAVAAAMLVDQGRLRYEDRVADHWPEFAANGKEAITIAQVLSHQAGLNGFKEPTTFADLENWSLITGRLAAQAPLWPPGSVASYHALTVGYLIGEVIRRVTGRSAGDFIADSIAGPLGADVFVGLRPGDDWRVSEIIAPPTPTEPPQPNEYAIHAQRNPAADALAPNRRAWRAAEVPAANGQASAQGLARVYAALANGGTLDGTTLLSHAGLDALRAQRHPGPDQQVGPRQWAAGMTFDVAPNYGPHADTFGHSGWGGAYGCANVARNVSIGYAMNRMGGAVTPTSRGPAIAAAVFACVDG